MSATPVISNPFAASASTSTSTSSTSSSPFATPSASSSAAPFLFTAGGNSNSTGGLFPASSSPTAFASAAPSSSSSSSSTQLHHSHSPAQIISKSSRQQYRNSHSQTNLEGERKEEIAQTLAAIRRGFNSWDLNRDGTISVDDVAKVLNTAGLNTSNEELRSFFPTINDQQRITYEAYEKAYLRKMGLNADAIDTSNSNSSSSSSGSSSGNVSPHSRGVGRLHFEHPADPVADMAQDLDRKKLQYQHRNQ